jgi:hypothetical protein
MQSIRITFDGETLLVGENGVGRGKKKCYDDKFISPLVSKLLQKQLIRTFSRKT